MCDGCCISHLTSKTGRNGKVALYVGQRIGHLARTAPFWGHSFSNLLNILFSFLFEFLL